MGTDIGNISAIMLSIIARCCFIFWRIRFSIPFFLFLRLNIITHQYKINHKKMLLINIGRILLVTPLAVDKVRRTITWAKKANTKPIRA